MTLMSKMQKIVEFYSQIFTKHNLNLFHVPARYIDCGWA